MMTATSRFFYFAIVSWLASTVSANAAEAPVCEEEVLGTSVTELAQVISGIAFIGLAMWLIFANTNRVTCAHKATYEQRLTVCVTINCAVTLFSGFFNILQLTSIDNFALPRDLPGQQTFTLDISRPIEWIMTCPIMQLTLAIMGGPRIPPYRRFFMPLLSVSLLLCGTASMFAAGPIRYAWFGFGIILAFIMFSHNAKQVRENSDGSESLCTGSSDYRVLSLYLIATWFPFPMWFALSVEGFGVITDVIVIHMGWVVLNIVSKFGFIIYLQNVKTAYCNKLRATRELYGVEPSGDKGEDPLKDLDMTIDKVDMTKSHAELITVSRMRGSDSSGIMDPDKFMKLVAETMAALGMREHSDRFQKLMMQAGIVSVEKLNTLTEPECIDANLPFNLISAVQRRHRMEQMEKVAMSEDFPKKYIDADKEGQTVSRSNSRPTTATSTRGDVSIDFNSQMQGMQSYARDMVMEISEASTHRMHLIEERLSLLLLKMDEQRDGTAQQVAVHLGAMIADEAQKSSEQLMAQFAANGNALAQHVVTEASRAAGQAAAQSAVEQREHLDQYAAAARDQMTQLADRLAKQQSAAATSAAPMAFGNQMAPPTWQSESFMKDLQQRDEERDGRLQETLMQMQNTLKEEVVRLQQQANSDVPRQPVNNSDVLAASPSSDNSFHKASLQQLQEAVASVETHMQKVELMETQLQQQMSQQTEQLQHHAELQTEKLLQQAAPLGSVAASQPSNAGIAGSHQDVLDAVQRLERKTDSNQDSTATRIQDCENRVLQKIEEQVTDSRDQVLQVTRQTTEGVVKAVKDSNAAGRNKSSNEDGGVSAEVQQANNEALKKDVKALVGEGVKKINKDCEDVKEGMRTTVAAVEERVVDIRRMNMMVMEMITGLQEKTESVTDNCTRKLSEVDTKGLQEAMSYQFSNMRRDLEELCNSGGGGFSSSDGGGGGGGGGKSQEIAFSLDEIKTQMGEMSGQLSTASRGLMKINGHVCDDGSLNQQIGNIEKGMQKFEFAIGKILKALPAGGGAAGRTAARPSDA